MTANVLIDAVRNLNMAQHASRLDPAGRNEGDADAIATLDNYRIALIAPQLLGMQQYSISRSPDGMVILPFDIQTVAGMPSEKFKPQKHG